MCADLSLSCRLYRFDLVFKVPATTSRGTYRTHTVWYPMLRTDFGVCVGECAPLPDLSCDFLSCGDNHDERLCGYEKRLCAHLEKVFCSLRKGERADLSDMRDEPSMLFGIETLLASYAQSRRSGGSSSRVFDSEFTEGREGIAINGLIWMGSFEQMAERMAEKLQAGFHCIKLKIGAIDFERELELLAGVRERFGPEVLELRVDANGAFSGAEAEEKLQRLAKFSLHSIEQPVRAGQTELMARLCRSSPVPVALDEELIGVNRHDDKKRLLDAIRPAYIILKPSLHGGIQGCGEWIELARERGIGFWMTSALESNVGLNAIAQWCASLKRSVPGACDMPQGLGTGLLYTNNVESPLFLDGPVLHCDPRRHVDCAERIADFLQDSAECVLSLS